MRGTLLLDAFLCEVGFALLVLSVLLALTLPPRSAGPGLCFIGILVIFTYLFFSLRHLAAILPVGVA